MTTALFLLRCVELGLNMSDLEKLTVGMVVDMYLEKHRDMYGYTRKATQEDMDGF